MALTLERTEALRSSALDVKLSPKTVASLMDGEITAAEYDKALAEAFMNLLDMVCAGDEALMGFLDSVKASSPDPVEQAQAVTKSLQYDAEGILNEKLTHAFYGSDIDAAGLIGTFRDRLESAMDAS